MAVILAGIAQLVERWLPKPKAAGSNPVSRSIQFQLNIFSKLSQEPSNHIFSFEHQINDVNKHCQQESKQYSTVCNRYPVFFIICFHHPYRKT